METLAAQALKAKASDEAIKGLLYFLQQELAKRMEDVPKEFTQLNEEDPSDWTKQSATGIQNPLELMLGVSDKIEVPIKEMVRSIILRFFKNNSDIIESIFKNKETEQEHYYFIILKQDTDAYRTIFFDFISHLTSVDITQKYPVCFQFVPREYKPKIMHLQEVVSYKS
jgi:hypothetical protein